MGVFGGISNAKFSEGGVYVLPGVYRFEILACKQIRTRTQKDGFVVELRVLESSNATLPPGSACSWMVTLDKEPALGNIKQFIATAVPCDMEQVDEAAVEMIVSDKNPLKGRHIRASATEIKTKANRPFTKVKWLLDSIGAQAAANEHAA